jgi:threonine dehydrogenase-like Zn-dependent dehydrogenase
MLGAERVIAIDRIAERLQLAAEKSGAETISYEKEKLFDVLSEITGGRCISMVPGLIVNPYVLP